MTDAEEIQAFVDEKLQEAAQEAEEALLAQVERDFPEGWQPRGILG